MASPHFFTKSSGFNINGGNFQGLNGSHFINNIVVSPATAALKNPQEKKPGRGRRMEPGSRTKDSGNKKGRDTPSTARRESTKAAKEREAPTIALVLPPSSPTSEDQDATGKIRRKPAGIADASVQRNIAPGDASGATFAGQLKPQQTEMAGKRPVYKRMPTSGS
ncbi:hypothetical protein MVEN_01060000 [Mycena venus]|uniref:Uncharacterized protein n=1 Tax=Mycena venus TaxID=2733690 RepID=A0A8H6Y7R5_9AGAR|nr:hypothetical protein MVEN_01060000 [Mycena venus]